MMNDQLRSIWDEFAELRPRVALNTISIRDIEADLAELRRRVARIEEHLARPEPTRPSDPGDRRRPPADRPSERDRPSRDERTPAEPRAKEQGRDTRPDWYVSGVPEPDSVSPLSVVGRSLVWGVAGGNIRLTVHPLHRDIYYDASNSITNESAGIWRALDEVMIAHVGDRRLPGHLVQPIVKRSRWALQAKKLPWMNGPGDPGGGGISRDVRWTASLGAAELWTRELDLVTARWAPIALPDEIDVIRPRKLEPRPYAMTRGPLPTEWIAEYEQPGEKDWRGFDGWHLSRQYRAASWLAIAGDPAAKYILSHMASEVALRWALNMDGPDESIYRPEHLENPALSPWWYDGGFGSPAVEVRAGRELFHSINLLRLCEVARLHVPRKWFKRLGAVAERAIKWSESGVAHLVPPSAPDPPQIEWRNAGQRQAVVSRGFEADMMASVYSVLWLSGMPQFKEYLRKYELRVPFPSANVFQADNPQTGVGSHLNDYGRAFRDRNDALWWPYRNPVSFAIKMRDGASTLDHCPLDWMGPAGLRHLAQLDPKDLKEE